MGQVSLMQLSPIISRQWVQWNMDEVHGIDMQETRKVVENKFPTRDWRVWNEKKYINSPRRDSNSQPPD